MVHSISTQEKFDLLCQMQRIRLVEEGIASRYHEGKMRCPTHLSIGQEAVAVAVGAVINSRDFAVSTHRAHAHYLAKGGNLPAMVAEIYGKATGCSRGKGGSMHLIDTSVGFMGTSAIVGNSIPIGVGLALSAQIRGSNQVSCIFLGDGAIEEGAFYECVNFACVRKLPVVFICENNLYSVYSPLSVRQPEGRSIAKMVEAIGAQSFQGDGNNVLKARLITAEAVDNARNGSGPQFIEFMTYRWREHCGPEFDNDLGYRTVEEFELWRERDPIALLQTELAGSIRDFELKWERANEVLKDEILEAFEFAENSPFPPAEEAFTGDFAVHGLEASP